MRGDRREAGLQHRAARRIGKAIRGAHEEAVGLDIIILVRFEDVAARLEDMVGDVEIIVFPRDYEKNRELIEEDRKVLICGKVSVEEDKDAKIICQNMMAFESAPRDLWIRFPDREKYISLENEMNGIEPDPDGYDTLIVYLEKEMEMKVIRGEKVRNLSISKQQMIEIMKVIHQSADIIIMDEPTTSLSENEKLSLFKIIRMLKDEGKTILYISHMLEEIFITCDRISILKDGVYEGRRIYGNIMKYMKMALSGNFGNVFSVLVASIFLPFLPMIPVQMLIQNLVYDFTQIAIPWDNVDEEFMRAPKKWDTHSLSRFMNVLGPVSSVFDVATFAILWFVLGYRTVGQQALFQTGWFIEGLISQTTIVHFIRTSKIPFIESRADIRLIFSSFCGILAAIVLPQALHMIPSFHFTFMPAAYYGYLVIILVFYAVAIEAVKRIYIKKEGEWL